MSADVRKKKKKYMNKRGQQSTHSKKKEEEEEKLCDKVDTHLQVFLENLVTGFDPKIHYRLELSLVHLIRRHDGLAGRCPADHRAPGT